MPHVKLKVSTKLNEWFSSVGVYGEVVMWYRFNFVSLTSVPPQNTQTQNTQVQNTQGQNTQSPKIPKAKIRKIETTSPIR